MLIQERITLDPGQCGGKPCIRGLRLRVSDVLGLLARGLKPAEVLKHFPYLEEQDVAACLEYAAEHKSDSWHTIPKVHAKSVKFGNRT